MTSQARPLFILGAPRSGTSLVYKALCLHRDAAWISNWMRRLPGIPELSVLNLLGATAPATRRSVWFGRGGNAYVYGRRRGVLERAFPQPVEGVTVFDHLGVPEPQPHAPAGDPDLERKLAKATGLVRHWSRARVFVNKCIDNNTRVALLDATYPNSVFLHVIRDGRAVAYSSTRVDWWEDHRIWWYGGTPRDWAAEGRDKWELAARNWVEEVSEVEAKLGALGPERSITIAYEELVRAPQDTLHQIAAFAGLASNADATRVWTSELDRLSYPNKNEKWPDALDAATIDQIEAIQGELLRKHGYLP